MRAGVHLSPSWLEEPALRAVLAALPGARPVGGCVRDALAGHNAADIDIAVPMPPEQIIAALDRAGLRSVPTGLAHGTVTALSGGKSFEATSLRRDIATDGRHAEVAFTDDWRADAARRDFTINAMSLSADGTLHDYFGGAEDLSAGRVRFVGDAAQRVAEDRLRALRFFRFHARYGRGEPDTSALTAITAMAAELPQLSAERIWSELRRILTGPHLAETLRAMQGAGVLAALFPAGFTLEPLAEAVANGMPDEAVPRLALLAARELAEGEPPIGEAPELLARRLRLSNAEAARLAACRDASIPVWDGDAAPAALRRLLADHAAQTLIDRAWVSLRGGHAASLAAHIAGVVRPVFPLAGRDVLKAGLAAPGPALGRLLAAARAEWLRDGCPEGDTARKALLEWLRASGEGGGEDKLPRDLRQI